jgi:hypothetical protein
MPSFPAEPARTATVTPSATSVALSSVITRYDEALGAVLQGHVEAIDILLDDVDRQVARITALATRKLDATEAALHAVAMERHGALVSALRALHTTTADDLARARQGRLAVSGYRLGVDASGGTRVDADA